MSDLALFPASAGSHNKSYVFLCVSAHQLLLVPFHSGFIPSYLINCILLFLKLCFAVLVAALHRFEGKKGNWKMLMCVNCFCMVYLGCPVNEETPNNT